MAYSAKKSYKSKSEKKREHRRVWTIVIYGLLICILLKILIKVFLD